MSKSTIEYFYSAHSGYAYLGSARFMEIAKAAGRTIDHRPMHYDAVVAVTGPGVTATATPGRRVYFGGREIERWSEFRSVPVMDGPPTHHFNDMTVANSMLIAGIKQGVNVDQLAHLMLEAHWRDDADLADRETLAHLGDAAGLEAKPLLEAALTPEIQTFYAANTEEAIRRSVFGSPTYFVDGDMFFGQDHLDVVARALEKPFAGQWPKVA